MNDLAFRDRAVYFPDAATLVVADTHVGRDEASGVEFPLGERADLRERLEALLAHFEPREVVFAGDVLHQFGDVTPDAESGLRELLDCCAAADATPVLVAGNHDTLLDEVYDGAVHDCYRLEDAYEGEDVLVAHGHEEPAETALLYVVGHDHPAIDIEGRKRPCYLYGSGVYRGGDVLMLPAFNRLAAGATVNGMWGTDFQSPLVSSVNEFRPVVYDPDSQETLPFPPLGRLRRML
ncbi:metallophosphoesterase [Halobium salinum]|uniref:Metallophosphoesterase n=1 Tax=Halobium salinum TaxID=1364940 RepID=A0ABD5PCV7_9EURY|nr:metallophosphoesterase [Halobium salinum]